ncbi:signal transduction histidine kinase [Pontibacter ummariensis]|uniref:histidine kinase n=1 Tax=Pontibacter ummariensis TaxID=1610492 RepID=A0A239LEQ8_9BACT|nr:tetratricopeptide repeat-containing sensor histidine kinase [Pontibacter ummariensis]PRY03655.1 signal transduction histidine kinase [Pontibacter ummariensis]SNT28333.1 Signal transduction histidine kinase [Pontibacter ummariensis]
MRLRKQFLLAAVVGLGLFTGTITVAKSRSSDVPGSKLAVYQKIDSLHQAAFEVKRSNIDDALSLLGEASSLAIEHNYTKGQATNLFYEAGIYQQYGYAKKALALYYKALELSRKTQDTFNIARVNQQIGSALLNAGNTKGAEKLFKEARRNYQVLGRKEDLANVTNNLGLVKLEQKELEEAEKYFVEALEASSRINYRYGLKKANYHLGLLYLIKSNLPTSRSYFEKALKVDEDKGDKYGLALTKNQLALVALREKAYQEAIQWARAALGDAQEISAAELEVEAIENLIAVYKALGAQREVIRWQEGLIHRQWQTFKEEKEQTLDFLDLLKKKDEEQLVFEKQALEARQKAEITNTILGLVSLGMVMLTFLAYMWYKNYRKARSYNAVLTLKNEEIKKHVLKLDELNQTISWQNKSLEESNNMKDKLFSIVSHDLRSPFASLKGILNLVQHRPMSQDEIKKIFGLLNEEVDVVMAMLGNLLDWSKAQLKGREVVLEPVWLHQLVEENIQLISRQAKQKHIVLQNDVAVDALALADKERLNFVIRNLLTNALKFTFEGGHIVVQADETPENITLSVSDDGKGISADNLEKLFQEGSRFTTIGTAQEKGTGLGLTLSRDFVQSIGGSISVESKEREGSTFYVTMPKPLLTVSDSPAIALS